MLTQIGLIGLGVMGENLTLNIAEKGHRISVFNRNYERTEEFYSNAGEWKNSIIPCKDLSDFVLSIKPPRPVLLMIPAGKPVDDYIGKLINLLSPGDSIIDAGNADFNDTRRRVLKLKESNIHFIGIGVSGGKEGARFGPSIMAGGSFEGWKHIEPLILDIAAPYGKEKCAAWMGPDGAGHFVKTIHNGIEYADMQMIAEIYGILRDGSDFPASQIPSVFGEWNNSFLNSYLIEITEKVLSAQDPLTKKPIVESIEDNAGQKGTGKWASIEAQKLGSPAPSIEAAVTARLLSSQREERLFAQSLYKKSEKKLFLGDHQALINDLKYALFAGKILVYAQGFSILLAASKEFDWNLPLPVVAKIWRAGCIIRSQLLDKIAKSLTQDDNISLLLAPAFVEMIEESHPYLRKVVSKAMSCGLPVPALSSALSWFDSYRQGYGTANLIQAQRDFFGAHGFRRIDQEGDHHGPW